MARIDAQAALGLVTDPSNAQDALFRRMVELLARELGADAAVVGEALEGGQLLRTAAVFRDGQIRQDFECALVDTHYGRLWSKGQSASPVNVRVQFPWDPLLQDIGVECALALPLFDAEARPLGLVALLWRRDVADMTLADQVLRLFAGRAVAELMRRRAEERLRHASAELAQSQNMRRAVAYTAHDIKNLLGVCRSYAEVILEGLRPSDASYADAHEILRAICMASSLTRGLFALGRERSEPLAIRVADVVWSLERILGRLLGEGVDLVTSFAPDTGWVRAHGGDVERILLNLAANARDAIRPRGRFTIQVSNVEVEARAAEQVGVPAGPYVLVRVNDDGSGMDGEALSHAFDPFYTTKARDGGTGLGLSNVLAIVRRCGGFVTVSSEIGRGTTFDIRLPRVPPPEEAP
jgi:signal transduction histidine kinase